MAKKQDSKLPEDGENKPKKKGLFNFLRRNSKSKSDVADHNNASVDKGSTSKKQSSKKASTAKNKSTKSAKKQAPKKRGQPKKQELDAEIVSAEATENNVSPQKKRSLFGFLKRNKKSNSEGVDVTAKDGDEKKPSPKGTKKPVDSQAKTTKKTTGKTSKKTATKTPVKKLGRPKKVIEEPKIAASEVADETVDKLKKKWFRGLLKRNKKNNNDAEHSELVALSDENSTDISVPPVGGDVLQMELDPEIVEDVSEKKSGFFTKKIIIIIIALCGVSGATGAAAIVFAGPLLGDDPLKGLACKVAHKADFVLMKEKRVTAFIRSDFLPPRQRIEMLMSYTKFLESEYVGANLITVSMIDTQGPSNRADFRGDNIGAQVVYAPDPLLSMATNSQWEVRYVNVEETYGGRFMGDRFTLSQEEINDFNNDQLLALDCYTEKTDEELEAEELAAETAAAEEEAAVMEPNGDLTEEHEQMETSEPGFMDNMLGMVGFGSDEHAEGEIEMVHGEELQQIYPGDKGPNADVMQEQAGFFDNVLSIVGLGNGDDDLNQDKIPGVLGTRVKYN
ncbi:hypothetical protein [Lentilitoribacter sp. EG35]|uniref:hypothetical protein n=1 Tax=Lentilitoribacter sp. EG35 TaxID=3234192 RepID=UPI00346035A1